MHSSDCAKVAMAQATLIMHEIKTFKFPVLDVNLRSFQNLPKREYACLAPSADILAKYPDARCDVVLPAGMHPFPAPILLWPSPRGCSTVHDRAGT